MEQNPPETSTNSVTTPAQSTQDAPSLEAVVVENEIETPPLTSPPPSSPLAIGFLPQSSSTDDIPPPKPDFYAPPPYEVVASSKTTTKLPTYEEVQREKHLEEQNVQIGNIPARVILSQYRQPGQRILNIENETAEDVDTTLLGTDFMFYIAFFVAFIFNWIGFLLLMCFCHTIASRYGALSGFGLSLAKWTFIVQHSTDLASKDNSWLWWLIMTFGLIICIRAILQYLSIKRGWHMLSASHQERLLFFY